MHETYKKWLDDDCPIVICQCGCNEEIVVKNHHKYYGIPKYISSHRTKSKEIRQKMSDAKKGKHWKLSEKTKQKMSDAKKGQIPWNKGLKGVQIPWNKGKINVYSEDSIQKMQEAKKGKHLSEETKQKISKIKKDSNAGKGENHYNFNNWSSKGKYCKNWTEEVREKIRNEYGRKCYICRKDEKDNITKSGNIRKLSVHHIDSDKEQGCNGKPFKLVPVCMKCHGKVHNHKIVKD